MGFVPAIPLSGYAGWLYLSRTRDAQEAAHAASGPAARTTNYFRANIARATTADALLADRKLLDVALGAFGLSADRDNTAFLRKVLTEGTTDAGAFARRLADPRYAALAAAFGYGDGGARVAEAGFADRMVARFRAESFEEAVGKVDGDLRQALNVGSALTDILGRVSGDDGRWFALMGDLPLRGVFETALGLPSSLGKLDIDRQLDIFRSRATAVFGTADVAAFADPARQEDLIRLFMIRSAASESRSMTAGRIALTLLGK